MEYVTRQGRVSVSAINLDGRQIVLWWCRRGGKSEWLVAVRPLVGPLIIARLAARKHKEPAN